MRKKIFIIAILTVILAIFSISYTCAASQVDNVVNDVRNFVGGTENVVENAGNSIASGVKNGMNTIGNGASAVGNTVENAASDVGNTVGAVVTDNNNGSYTATRTATDTNMSNGINSAGWTWFIIGVTAIAIGVLVWSYIRENRMNNSYIDSNR